MKSRKQAPIIIDDGKNEARIYTIKSRSGESYQLCYYLAGKRQRRTFSDLGEAKREARHALGRMAGAQLEVETLSGGELEAFVVARRTVEPTGIPLPVASQIFARAHEILAGRSIIEAADYYMKHYDPKRPRKPLPDLVDDFIESRRRYGGSERYLANCRVLLNRFLKSFGKLALDDLEAVKLDDWLTQMPLANYTRKNFRIILVCFGNFLKKREFLPSDRPTVFERTQEFRTDYRPPAIYTPDEMRKLFTHARDFVVPYLAIAAFAGLRNSEICRLDWNNIHLERGFIECPAFKTKTRQRRLVPISENLKAWLLPYRVPSGPVILHKFVANVLLNLGTAAGIEWRKNALRHSYISYRLALVPDTARIALECGNSPDIIFKHYRELVVPVDAEEWFAITPANAKPQAPSNYRNKRGGIPRNVKSAPLIAQQEAA
jgi:integrase